MMKRYVYSIVCLMGMLIISSCVDKDDNCRVNGGIDENGEITRTFTLQLPSPIRNTSTYGMTDEDENSILTLDILAFKVNGTTETFAYRAQATKVEDLDDTYRYKTVTVKLRVSDDSYRFVFLANVASEIEALDDISTIGVKNEVLARLIHSSPGTKKWGDTIDDYFPMWGETVVMKITEDADVDEEVKMLRAVSRIDVVTDTDKVKNFEVTAAYIYNYNTEGHIVPDPNNVTNSKVSSPTIPTGVGVASKSPRYDAVNKVISQQIYTYESEAKTAHLEKTCLVVGGLFKTDENPNPSETWYRIDFIDLNKKDIHLLRNYCYTLNIISVNGEGYTDPDEAYEARPFNIEVEVLEWDQGEIRDIIFNGQYFLGVSESEIYLPKPAKDTSVIVTTDYPKGWTRTWEAQPWFTVTSNNEWQGIKTKDILEFSVTENNDGAQRIAKIHLKAGVLKHTITVYQSIEDEEEDGPPTDVNWLKNVGDANCYILSPSGDGIRIPVAQANKDGVPRIGDNDILEAEILWTDTPYPVGHDNCVIRYVGVSGKGREGFVEVVANGINGNALVAVKVNDKIRWSWHIWVLDYTPSETEGSHTFTYSSSRIIWMDRNIGALTNKAGDDRTMGLIYQWGRKDPFPGLDGFNATEGFKIYDKDGIRTYIKTDSKGDLEKSIENPMTFYTSTSTNNGDWMTTPNNNLWSISDNTIYYDPCPDGWTINQPISVWQSYASGDNGLGLTFSVNNKGANSSKIGYWPTTGRMDISGNFNVSKVGEEGYYWMGQANGLRSYMIKIYNNTWGCIEVGGNFDRGEALAVRCIKD